MFVTHVSFLNGLGRTTIMFSTQPLAGTSKGGTSITTSGFVRQPSTHWTGGGASFASPSIAPLSAHLAMVSISLCERVKLSTNFPYCGSSPPGGITPVITAAFIALAHGRVAWYVRNDIGAISPGLWQLWHLAWRIGRTSR